MLEDSKDICRTMFHVFFFIPSWNFLHKFSTAGSKNLHLVSETVSCRQQQSPAPEACHSLLLEGRHAITVLLEAQCDLASRLCDGSVQVCDCMDVWKCEGWVEWVYLEKYKIIWSELVSSIIFEQRLLVWRSSLLNIALNQNVFEFKSSLWNMYRWGEGKRKRFIT